MKQKKFNCVLRENSGGYAACEICERKFPEIGSEYLFNFTDTVCGGNDMYILNVSYKQIANYILSHGWLLAGAGGHEYILVKDNKMLATNFSKINRKIVHQGGGGDDYSRYGE